MGWNGWKEGVKTLSTIFVIVTQANGRVIIKAVCNETSFKIEKISALGGA